MSDILGSLSSSDLYTQPSFAKGTARIADFFGQLDEYNYRQSEQEADADALKRDWLLVGRDLFQALCSYGNGRK